MISFPQILSIYALYRCSVIGRTTNNELEDISHLKKALVDDEMRESDQLALIKKLNETLSKK